MKRLIFLLVILAASTNADCQTGGANEGWVYETKVFVIHDSCAGEIIDFVVTISYHQVETPIPSDVNVYYKHTWRGEGIGRSSGDIYQLQRYFTEYASADLKPDVIWDRWAIRSTNVMAMWINTYVRNANGEWVAEPWEYVCNILN